MSTRLTNALVKSESTGLTFKQLFRKCMWTVAVQFLIFDFVTILTFPSGISAFSAC